MFVEQKRLWSNPRYKFIDNKSLPMVNSSERAVNPSKDVFAHLRVNSHTNIFSIMQKEKNSLLGNNSTLQLKSVSLNETQLHSYFKDSKSANIEEVSLLFEGSREILEKAQSLLNLISYAQKTGHYQEEVENLNPVDIINCTELATKMLPFMPFVMFDEIKEEYFRLKNS